MTELANAQSPVFDPTLPWQLDERVALRPETFGALAYHFGTRRLTFLKSPRLFDVVRSLATHANALDACRANHVDERTLTTLVAALARLAETGMIKPRGDL
jgi:putative mycofactocin binding protein MftB